MRGLEDVFLLLMYFLFKSIKNNWNNLIFIRVYPSRNGIRVDTSNKTRRETKRRVDARIKFDFISRKEKSVTAVLESSSIRGEGRLTTSPAYWTYFHCVKQSLTRSTQRRYLIKYSNVRDARCICRINRFAS